MCIYFSAIFHRITAGWGRRVAALSASAPPPCPSNPPSPLPQNCSSLPPSTSFAGQELVGTNLIVSRFTSSGCREFGKTTNFADCSISTNSSQTSLNNQVTFSQHEFVFQLLVYSFGFLCQPPPSPSVVSCLLNFPEFPGLGNKPDNDRADPPSGGLSDNCAIGDPSFSAGDTVEHCRALESVAEHFFSIAEHILPWDEISGQSATLSLPPHWPARTIKPEKKHKQHWNVLLFFERIFQTMQKDRFEESTGWRIKSAAQLTLLNVGSGDGMWSLKDCCISQSWIIFVNTG